MHNKNKKTIFWRKTRRLVTWIIISVGISLLLTSCCTKTVVSNTDAYHYVTLPDYVLEVQYKLEQEEKALEPWVVDILYNNEVYSEE